MPRQSEIVILILVLALDPGASPIFVLGEAGGENGSIRYGHKFNFKCVFTFKCQLSNKLFCLKNIIDLPLASYNGKHAKNYLR